jgi:signal transduction histidine kinase
LNAAYLVLRYLTVVAAGVATILMTGRVADEALYVFLLLGLLLAMRLRDSLEEREAWRASPLPFVAEAAMLAAFAWRYGGLLPLAVPAALYTPPERSGPFLPRAAIAVCAMNAAAWPHYEAGMLAAANLACASIAMLLRHIRKTAVGRGEIEALYQELQTRHRELEEARRAALDYASKVQELAQLEERNRIAHDLHDELGHRLVRLKMMLEAAIRIEEGGARREAMGLVREVRDQLAGAMDALRSTVRRLKPADAARGEYSLETLIAELAEASGVSVRFRTVGEPRPLYPSDAIVLYRNAQEAVTNALRHGEAREVDVELEYAPEELRMTVSNSGVLPAGGEIRKGLGLLGMEERARLAGGRLEVSVGERFAVRTILPRR